MERVETINMKHRTDSEILTQLMALTRAKPVYATPEEVEQLRELEEARKQSLRDQTRSIKENEKRKKRDAMLAQARGEIAATQTA
jgi:large subunit ribosomal protein MRP49